MPNLQEILGNQNNIRHLKEAEKQGRLPHAYIIHGAAGSGKKTFAGYLAAALLCEKGIEEGPCKVCPSCVKAATHNHPDIIWTVHEKPTVLSVQEIRDQVVNTVHVAPYYGPYKIYIISDAQLLNEHGQNALLKTIEEPPEYVLVLILTDNADALLDTIRSRCIRLDMEALSSEEIEKTLIADGVPKGEAKECAGFARGNLGIAKDLAAGGLLRELKDETVKTLKNIKNLDAFELYNLSTEMDRLRGEKVLDIIFKWYRDMLITKSGAAEAGLYFANDKAVLQRQSADLSYESLGRIIDRTEESILRLQSGVKAEAVFEILYLKIREEYK